MSTTVVFVELLIIGAQTGTWLLLLVDVHLRPNVEQLLSFTPAALVVAALFYLLGIVTDRIAAFFCPILWTTEKLKRLKGIWFVQRKVERELSDETDIRYRVYFREGKFTTFLEFTLSRIRIVRATLINIPITAVVVSRAEVVQSELVVILVAALAFLVVFIVLAALLLTYDVLLRQTRDLIAEAQATGAPGAGLVGGG